MEIIPLLKKNNIKVLSIFGLSKNCGKTTTLIKLIQEAKDLNLKILVTSIGLDGERFDSLFYFEKPLIKGYKNNLIVTSKRSIEKIEIKYELIKKFNINTPLGELFLIKLLNDGFIEVSGPIILRDLKDILDEVSEYEVDYIFIDGAIDRKIGTFYSDGVILQTGLNVGEEAEEIIDETIFFKNIFTLNEPPKEIKDIIIKNYPEKKFLFIKKDETFENNEILDQNYDALFIKGALTNNILNLLKDKAFKKIVVEHPTKILIDRKYYNLFYEIKNKFYTLKKIVLIGISFSPFNQYKIFTKREEKRVYETIERLVKPIKIFNVLEKQRGLI